MMTGRAQGTVSRERRFDALGRSSSFRTVLLGAHWSEVSRHSSFGLESFVLCEFGRGIRVKGSVNYTESVLLLTLVLICMK